MTSLKEIWDSQAEQWARLANSPEGDRSYHLFHRDRFLELLPPPGRATLDIGCGEGRLTRELAARGHRITGIDASPRMVALAGDLALVADAAALPFTDESFDLAVAFISLQDMEDLDGAVAEAARVLERGGRFCVANLHPMATCGRFDSKEPDSAFRVTGSYLQPGRYDDVVDRDGFRVTLAGVHRPLEIQLRALERAGLLVETLRELPAPFSPRWSRIPLFFHVRAVKP